MIQRNYPIVTNEIQDDGTRKSTILLDVFDYSTEVDYGDEMS